MALPPSLKIALKEWAVVCDALTQGEQILLLRKGGISESAGEFQLENREFLLFPTYLHQNAQMLKLYYQRGVEKRDAEPAEITLSSAGVVTDIIQLQSRQQIDRLDDQHIWTAPLIDMRFNYRPENPLYLLLLRAYQLPAPITITSTPAYAGCKSWVPLDEPIDVSAMTPALDDNQYELRRSHVLKELS